ncbi:MAG: restriction endonuclease subunit S [Candidatus Marinimicrobia bacterium]|nr:restriction endonuclease subunit S [Candidatus Neomarinimicrobiota bacterium]
MGISRDYKQTEIGRIPREWEVVRIKDIGKVFTGKTPSTSKDIYWNGDIPFVTPEDMTGEKYVYRTNRYVSFEGANQSGKILPPNTVLVVCIGSTVGKVALTHKKSVTNQQINSVLCKEKVDHDYVYYAISYRSYMLKNYSGVAAVPIVKKSLFEEFKIPLPQKITEQQKIAEILSTVDEAIEKVDEAIAKTERLKKGLMQELLTKGIGHKEFKDTEIGRIPKEWEVVRLESLISEIKNGFASGKRDENGIVQIRMNNVTTDGQLILDSYLKVPIPDNVDDWILKEGDFLFNNTNSYDLVGKSTIFKGAPFPCTFSNHFTRIRFKKELVLPELILYHFLLLWEKGYFKSVAIRHVGQAAVHNKYLLKLKLPLPPLSEQQKIAEILSTIDKRLELLKVKKERLERVKKGLMNDLLTGRRRVKT